MFRLCKSGFRVPTSATAGPKTPTSSTTGAIYAENPASRLLQHYRASFVQIVFRKSKREKEHHPRANRQHPIGVNVRQRRGLRLEALIEPRQCLSLRLVTAQPCMH